MMALRVAPFRSSLSRRAWPPSVPASLWHPASAVGDQVRWASTEDYGRKGDRYFGWLREVFSEARIAERKESLRDELKRGYVNDLKELKANAGKAFRATDKLAAEQAAVPFPSSLRLVEPSGAPLPLPPLDGSVRCALVCVAFRNGAEEMLSSWREPFRAQFADTDAARIYELSLVDSALMGLWPFRGMIVRGARAAQARELTAPPPIVQYGFHFGNTRDERRALGITNLLTGYVYLVDGEGRVRWRGCGLAEPWEVEVMLNSSATLLGVDRRASHDR